MSRWSKITLRVFAVILILISIGYLSVAIYVNTHKKTLLVSITNELNKNLDGSLTIGNMEPTILKGFPGVSLTLQNVMVKDKKWSAHQHTLLDAKFLDISVNSLSLFRGVIEIRKATISDAAIYIFTDSTGYSNTSVFKKKSLKDSIPSEASNSSTEIRKFFLKNVSLVLNNRKGNKLFQFEIDKLEGKMDYESAGWNAKLDLRAFAKRLAFNTKKGSFIQNQPLEGPFEAVYDVAKGKITVKPNTLKIGDDPFIIAAVFNVAQDPMEFSISIQANQILWRSASALLAPNIKKRLDRFNLKQPIDVKCSISGNMGAGGDPQIVVSTDVKNNILNAPGSQLDSCYFRGLYTNNYIKGKGNTDSNSVVKLFGLKGLYGKIPVNIDTAFISNFDNPVASGVFRSKFPISKLNSALGNDILKFTDGIAEVNLKYRADLVNLVLNKPTVNGFVKISKADLSYVPRNLRFKDTDIFLKFIGPDLFIDNLRLQSGRSIVKMDGSVKNFMNLYYSAPEKILFKWNVQSPQLYLGEFLGLLSSRSQIRSRKSTAKTNFADNLYEVFDKSKMDIHLQVDKMVYKKFLATNGVAQLFVSEKGIGIQNFSLNHAGGSIQVKGNLYQQGNSSRFKVEATVKNANIKSLFYGFDNFGLKSLGYKNLTGNLFSVVHLNGRISNTGILDKNALDGTVAFKLKNGSLLNFDPLINVGKFAFPLRDLNNISIRNLQGLLTLRGQKVLIAPMKVSSSVLNVDVSGIYAMGPGTNIALDVPLRNPKKDNEILDAKLKDEKRMKGIVLHLLATDGEDGKIKIKLNKNRDKG